MVRATALRHSLLLLVAMAAGAPASSAKTTPHTPPPFDLKAAIRAARPGDVVRIPSGIYRDFFAVTQSGTDLRPIVIEGDSGNVVISGAEPLQSSRWEALPGGRIWRYAPWTYAAPRFHVEGFDRVYSGAQVIVDGTLLSQASTLPSMHPGTFFADPAHQRALFIWLVDGNSPAKHHIEASVRPELMSLTGNHIIVRNIVFRYASNVAQHAAVDLQGEHNLIENCVIEYTGGVGLHMSGRHNIARNITSQFNGQLGIGANGLDNLLEGCTLVGNNTLAYPTDWEAGGIKVVDTDGFRVSRCVAKDNNGTGFWFDIDNRRGVIEESYAADNTESGIGVEISQQMTVRNNVVVGNGLRAHGGWGHAGIMIAESMNSSVEYNIAVGNLNGIAVRQQGVRTLNTDGGLGEPRIVRFYSYGLTFRHNIEAFNREWQFAFFGDIPAFAGGYAWVIRQFLKGHGPSEDNEIELLDPSKWNWELDHNVYFAPKGSGLILWGAPWLPRHQTYDSVDEFRIGHHLDQESIVADPRFIDWKAGNFSLAPGSPAVRARPRP